MSPLKVGEFSDSFPPMIDGVAQAVKNYAAYLHRQGCDVTVVTPKYRCAQDRYPFPVVRYPSVPLGKKIGYRAGNPFDPETLYRLHQCRFDIIHAHAPFASAVLAQNLTHRSDVPVILTYHTRYDIDIGKRIKSPSFRRLSMSFMMENIRACDEVWVVSEGCGRQLKSLGFDGPCRVMENGTDFAYGQAPLEQVRALRERLRIPADCFVFLFVGRMMWYKNLRLMLDSLAYVKRRKLPFRALLVGGGYDADAIRLYAKELGLSREVIFAGAVYDREELRAFYTLTDMFLFPSTYDTSGIVVKEAAACCCPSLLVAGSCAAEGVTDRGNGFLSEENPAAYGRALEAACLAPEALRSVGRNAGETLYLSWDDAVARARQRYEEILKERS